MNLVATVGSPRKGRATDTLVDKAIEGYKSKVQNCNVKKLNLIEYDIQLMQKQLAIYMRAILNTEVWTIILARRLTSVEDLVKINF